MNVKKARLRKSYGPLSTGTRVEVLSYPTLTFAKDKVNQSGYATIRLESISHKLRAQVEKTQWRHILNAWDIEADMLVFARGTAPEA
jgi:hypothetical protein